MIDIRKGKAIVLSSVCALLAVFPAFGADIPGSADAGRIAPFERRIIPDSLSESSMRVPQVLPETTIPESAKQIQIRIDRVVIEGATAFSSEALADIYEPYIGRAVPLETLWLIAGQITERYRQAGYFLSRAFVPAQEIEDGTILIKVLEGYAGDVQLEGNTEPSDIMQAYMDRLRAMRPLSASGLEEMVMRLNDLPGINVTAYVRVLEGAPPGAVQLVLEPSQQSASGSISLNNFGSRFFGPYQAIATYQDSFIAQQQTTFSALTSLPADELQYGAIAHRIPIAPDWALELSGSYVASEPGASLEANDIDSSSINLGVLLDWQFIRQRRENLSFGFELAGQNTSSDILGSTALTRDRIRTASLLIDYDTDDGWDGYNYLSATLTQGLAMFGASNEGDLNLSRAQAEPDFTLLEASYARLQSVGADWLAVGQLSGQLASAPLFSAQEFGYGGNSIGRAYDSSEITGDHGVAGSLEMRYQSFDLLSQLRTVPYAFYDAARIWNEDSASKPESASSAGFGLRVEHPQTGLSGNFGLAFPLAKDIDTPIYGSGKNPRLILQLGLAF